MNYAIIIVTYMPDSETTDYIIDLAKNEQRVIVVDNSPRENELTKLNQLPNVSLIKNNANLGLAKALNTGVGLAINEGLSNLFLFDQDSRIPPNYTDKMLEFKRDNADSNTAIIGPNFVDTNIGTEARYSIMHTWTWHTVSCKNATQPLSVSFAITSGSLLDADAYKKLGSFRDDYFIDHIDSEYCLRAIKRGYNILVNCELTLRHQIGQRDIRKLLGLTIKPNNHNPKRRYFIFRNGVRMMLDYSIPYPSIITLNLARFAHELLSIIFFENRKLKKLRAIITGIVHGFLNKMGDAPSSID